MSFDAFGTVDSIHYRALARHFTVRAAKRMFFFLHFSVSIESYNGHTKSVRVCSWNKWAHWNLANQFIRHIAHICRSFRHCRTQVKWLCAICCCCIQFSFKQNEQRANHFIRCVPLRNVMWLIFFILILQSACGCSKKKKKREKWTKTNSLLCFMSIPVDAVFFKRFFVALIAHFIGIFFPHYCHIYWNKCPRYYHFSETCRRSSRLRNSPPHSFANNYFCTATYI